MPRGSRTSGRKGTPGSAAARGPVTAALVQRHAGVPPQAAGLPGDWFRPPVVGAHEPERQRLLCPHHPPPKGQSGGHRLRPCHWFRSPPLPPHGGLCWGALRVRWVALLALQPGTACAVLRGAPVSEFGPPPTPRRRRPRLQPQNPRGFRTLRAAPAPRLPPGAPRRQGKNPSPARRNASLAAWRAPAVKAPRATRGAGAALTAPAKPLGSGRRLAGKAGWGCEQACRIRSAPVGRGVPPYQHGGKLYTSSNLARQARIVGRVMLARLATGGSHGREPGAAGAAPPAGGRGHLCASRRGRGGGGLRSAFPGTGQIIDGDAQHLRQPHSGA